MRFFSGVLLLPCFVASVLGIFKDDAYHTDWHIPLIGPSLPTSTFFHQPNPDSKASLIYSLTDRSILAAINPKDGELVWRQQLKQSAVNVARAGNGVVVSATGTSVSSFHAGNGRLVWENAFSQNIVDLRITPANKVAVLFADGVVRLLDDKSGDVAWEWREMDRCANDDFVCAHGDANFLRKTAPMFLCRFTLPSLLLSPLPSPLRSSGSPTLISLPESRLHLLPTSLPLPISPQSSRLTMAMSFSAGPRSLDAP